MSNSDRAKIRDAGLPGSAVTGPGPFLCYLTIDPRYAVGLLPRRLRHVPVLGGDTTGPRLHGVCGADAAAEALRRRSSLPGRGLLFLC